MRNPLFTALRLDDTPSNVYRAGGVTAQHLASVPLSQY